MRKFIGYLGGGALIIAIIMAFTGKKSGTEAVNLKSSDNSLEIPEDVNTILKNHCFGCHNTESKNEKGKGKLTIDNLGELPTGKLAAKLSKIAEEVDEGEMPPKKFLEKYPEKGLSKKDKKKVINWAKAAAKEL